MKTTLRPALRITPELRRDAEAVLEDGETFSTFVVSAIQRQIEARRAQQLFLARGIANAERARRTQQYVSAADVLKGLKRRLETARARVVR